LLRNEKSIKRKENFHSFFKNQKVLSSSKEKKTKKKKKTKNIYKDHFINILIMKLNNGKKLELRKALKMLKRI